MIDIYAVLIEAKYINETNEERTFGQSLWA